MPAAALFFSLIAMAQILLWFTLSACAGNETVKREADYLARVDTSRAMPKRYQIGVTMEAKNRFVQKVILSDLVFFQQEVDRVASGNWRATQEDSALIKILAYYMSAEIDLFKLYLSQPDSAINDSLKDEN